MSVAGCATLTHRDTDYDRLKDFVVGVTGLAYYGDRDEEFVHRVSLRLNALGATSYSEYLEILRRAGQGEKELDLLIEHLTIGETHFFRHKEMFDALCNIVAPSILCGKHGRSVRIWSAGCSTGAEPYSVVIALMRDVRYNQCRWDLAVLGTDINRHSLQQAHQAKYSEWDLRGTDEDQRRSCFDREDDRWTVRPEYRRRVSFQYFNLVRFPFPSLENNIFAFDVILCRNVLMYFDRSTTARLIKQLHESLVEGGWLLVGHSEPNLELFSAFETILVPGAVLYQKNGPNRSLGWVPPRLFEAHIPAPTLGNVEHHDTRRVRQAAKSSEGEIKPDERVLRIRRLADEGHLDDAERLCRQWMDQCPFEPVPCLYLGLIFDHNGQWEEALQMLHKVIYLDPRMVIGHYHLGLVFQRIGDWHQAARAYRNCQQLLPGDDLLVVPFSDGLQVADIRKSVASQLMNVRYRRSDHGH